MRRIVLFSLALLPAIAYGQASTATSVQTTTPATDLQARVSAPPALNHVEPASANIATASRPLKTIITMHAEPLTTQQSLRQGGTLSYSFKMDGNDASAGSTAPVLTHVIGVGVNDIASNNADVTVRMTVDQHGVPTNLKIARSAGAELDNETLAAVSQYRFKPATYNRLPVDSAVTVDVKLQK